MKVIIINGPNLNLLGKREVDIYGNVSFDDYYNSLRKLFPDINLSYFQSNIEGELIDKLHEVGFTYDYIILNGGGYSHTSIALSDAVSSIDSNVIEVHISNIYNREEFRKNSFISPVVNGIIAGFGTRVYQVAINSLKYLSNEKTR